ncbi:DUF4350 domain-containing protein [Janibacter sp. GS2]|uniref:DUF4350 domain-containing protein n=1 Tax=Janibacter sp. GS2 TaxID=3442646 RepID=UPI003EB7E188
MTRRLTRGRVLLTVVVLLAFAALVVLTLGATRTDRPLDPDSPGPSGARALSAVLQEHDVQVEVVRTIDGLEDADVDAETTVVVSATEMLSPGHAERVPALSRGAARLVLLEASPLVLERADVPVTVGPGTGGSIPADCTGAPSLAAGIVRHGDEVEAPSLLYSPARGTRVGRCFDADDSGAEGSALVVVPEHARQPETVLLAATTTLSNRDITDADHAGLGVRLLGASDRLVWYSPSLADLAADEEHVAPPRWLVPAMTLLGMVIVLVAVQQGRRLGPLTPEKLPVVVHSVETTRSRAALYRRAGDRARAARVLRAATDARVRARLGLSERGHPQSVVAAAASASGLSPGDVHDRLFGPPPGTDATLIQLAHRLTALEEGVRTP